MLKCPAASLSTTANGPRETQATTGPAHPRELGSPRAAEASPLCPLCGAAALEAYHQDKRREYFRCRACDLVSVAPSSLPDRATERAEYDLHQNAVGDLGYRAFLNRALEPVVARLPPPACGLDFGCGPGPALAEMFREKGYIMSAYDPLYACNPAALAARYDFVTCTEVIEHVHHPRAVWAQLVAMLKPAGLLVVMTKRVRSRAAFATWHYKNDRTHVAFYSASTLEHVARTHECSLELPGADVAVFRGP